MKTIIGRISLLLILISFSCSSSLIRENSALETIKKPGLIFRTSFGSKITNNEFTNNTLFWLNNYEKNSDLIILGNLSDPVSSFKYTQERFFQLSADKDFLKYKSLGLINLYLQNNRNELLTAIAEQKLDSIVIYEVYNVISTEMQFLDYDTVITIIDKNLNIIYLDYATKHTDTDSNQLEQLKSQMMDELDSNLTSYLQDVRILGSRTEKGKLTTVTDDKKSEESAESQTNTSSAEEPEK